MQLSYSTNYVAGRAGADADGSNAPQGISGLAASANVQPGMLVYATGHGPSADFPTGGGPYYHTAQQIDVIPGASYADPLTPAQFLGITRLDVSREPLTNNLFAQGDDVTVKTKGRTWVAVEAAVAFGQDVYVRIAAGGSGIGLGFRATAASGFAKVPGARWRSNTAGAGIAIVELNQPL